MNSIKSSHILYIYDSKSIIYVFALKYILKSRSHAKKLNFNCFYKRRAITKETSHKKKGKTSKNACYII